MSFLLPGLALSALIAPLAAPVKYAPFIPLLGWTFGIQWFIDEYYYFSSWTMMPTVTTTEQEPDRVRTTSVQRDALLGRWFQNWFYRGGICAGVFTPLTFSSSLVVLYRHFRSSLSIPPVNSPATWTAIGFMLSVYHIRYGNSQYLPFKRIGTPGNEGNNIRDMTGWVEMHKRRILWIDVPAWICFAAAAGLSLES